MTVLVLIFVLHIAVNNVYSISWPGRHNKNISIETKPAKREMIRIPVAKYEKTKEHIEKLLVHIRNITNEFLERKEKSSNKKKMMGLANTNKTNELLERKETNSEMKKMMGLTNTNKTNEYLEKNEQSSNEKEKMVPINKNKTNELLERQEKSSEMKKLFGLANGNKTNSEMKKMMGLTNTNKTNEYLEKNEQSSNEKKKMVPINKNKTNELLEIKEKSSNKMKMMGPSNTNETNELLERKEKGSEIKKLFRLANGNKTIQTEKTAEKQCCVGASKKHFFYRGLFNKELIKRYQYDFEKLKEPRFALSNKELQYLGDKFLNNIANVGFQENFTEHEIKMMSKLIVKYIKLDLNDTEEIAHAIKSRDDFNRDWVGENIRIRDIINKEFSFIKRYNLTYKEKERFAKILKDLDRDSLTEVERIAINLYSQVSTANDFLRDLEHGGESLFSAEANAENTNKSTLKRTDPLERATPEVAMIHAKLLQTALKKLSKVYADNLVSIDHLSDKNGKDPFEGIGDVTISRFMSALDVSDLPKKEIDQKVNGLIKSKRAPRIKINFIDTCTGVDISPYVAPEYLMNREVLFPIGSKFLITKKKPSSDKVAYEYNFRQTYECFK